MVMRVPPRTMLYGRYRLPRPRTMSLGRLKPCREKEARLPKAPSSWLRARAGGAPNAPPRASPSVLVLGREANSRLQAKLEHLAVTPSRGRDAKRVTLGQDQHPVGR